MIYLWLLLIPTLSILAHMAGGGFGAHKIWKPLPEILFSLPFGFTFAKILYPFLHFTGFPYVNSVAVVIFGLMASLWSYLWMQTGHTPALKWGVQNKQYAANNPRRITPVVNFISFKLFDFTMGDRNYCRTHMALKGFLIGLPVGGIPLMILWPFAYETGHNIGHHKWSEMLSGAFSGAVLSLILILLGG